MSSLIALPLLVLWIVTATALFLGRGAKRGGRGGWFASAYPALAVLVAVLGACLAGWLIAVAMANL